MAQSCVQPPQAEAVRAVVRALASLHGMPQRPSTPSHLHDINSTCGSTPSVVEALVATVLSQNTTQKNSAAAMANLMATYNGDWQAICDSTPARIAHSIRIGGLSNVKGARIHALLQDIARTHGALSLQHLHELDDAAAKAALQSYHGVGPKTASCVLLFCLGRDSFAVDTHVLRICKRLGWVPGKASREQAYALLDVAIPDAEKYPLHVLLVQHGKTCPECAAQGRPQRPPLGPCPLGPHSLQVAPRSQATAKQRSNNCTKD